MTADPINAPCRHGDSIVTCPDCLNDEIEATVLLAGLDEGVYRDAYGTRYGYCNACGDEAPLYGECCDDGEVVPYFDDPEGDA